MIFIAAKHLVDFTIGVTNIFSPSNMPPLQYNLCAFNKGSLPEAADSLIMCTNGAYGRYLSIWKETGDLILCEVQVFGVGKYCFDRYVRIIIQKYMDLHCMSLHCLLFKSI